MYKITITDTLFPNSKPVVIEKENKIAFFAAIEGFHITGRSDLGEEGNEMEEILENDLDILMLRLEQGLDTGIKDGITRYEYVINSKIEQENKSVTQIAKALATFEYLQDLYIKFGAKDTEPDTVFQETLMEAFDGSVPIPETIEDWSLYDKPGADTAAKKLGKATKRIVDVIQDNPQDYDATLQHVSKYCWRLS
jgi:hypothetical protein